MPVAADTVNIIGTVTDVSCIAIVRRDSVGKVQKPLKIIVIGREDSEIWKHPDVRQLMERGDHIERVDLEADIVMGETAFRTFPDTVKFTIRAIEGIRKHKPKPEPKDESGKTSKKGKGKGKAASTQKPTPSQGEKAQPVKE